MKQEIRLEVVRVVDAPHPWKPSVVWFRNTDRWLFQTKLDDARRLRYAHRGRVAWDERARRRRWLTWIGAR